MMAFAICMLGAGALLSLLVRVPSLVLVLLGFCAAVAAATVLSSALGATPNVPIALLVAVVALQAGYGLGVVLRAVALKYARRDRRDKRVQPVAHSAKPNFSGPHDSGPLNQP